MKYESACPRRNHKEEKYRNQQNFPSVRVNGQEIDFTFTKTEFRLLCFLVENMGRIVTGEILLSYVWGFNEEICLATAKMYIMYLRNKLKGAGISIYSKRGIGYYLVIDDLGKINSKSKL